jgi:hypothetical protein
MQARTGYPHIATETLNNSSLFWGYGIDAGIDSGGNKQYDKDKPQGASQTELAAKLFSKLLEYLLEIFYASRTSRGRPFPVHGTHLITSLFVGLLLSFSALDQKQERRNPEN